MRVLFLIAGLALLVAPPASADDDYGVDSGSSQFVSHFNSETSLDEPGSTGGNAAPVVSTPPPPTLAQTFCFGPNGQAEACTAEPSQPQLTGEMIWQAFAQTPMPPSQLIIQPPNGRTLVNFDTNFYTDAPEETVYPVPLGPVTIELRVWPASFTWHFGDGETLQTTERGAAYPALDITHRYLSKGDVAPSLDTTYAAEWRLQGGAAWQPVQGTVTIAGEPSSLRVLTATPTLVG